MILSIDLEQKALSEKRAKDLQEEEARKLKLQKEQEEREAKEKKDAEDLLKEQKEALRRKALEEQALRIKLTVEAAIKLASAKPNYISYTIEGKKLDLTSAPDDDNLGFKDSLQKALDLTDQQLKQFAKNKENSDGLRLGNFFKPKRGNFRKRIIKYVKVLNIPLSLDFTISNFITFTPNIITS